MLRRTRSAMPDSFGDMSSEQPGDPMAAAQLAMRQPLRARFYQRVTMGAEAKGFPIELDGRLVRTPARRTLGAPIGGLAETIAAEWRAQDKVIDPARMPLTRLANSIIDGVVSAPQPVRAEIERYLNSDLLFYRADGPEGLLAKQALYWDPIVEWARTILGARFVLAQGVTHVRQPQDAIAAAMQAVPEGRSPLDLWRLGALNSVTTLTGSALLALALAAGQIGSEQAWSAAHVDEDWNMEFWGRDALALERREFRFAEMKAAATVLKALSASPYE
jgi:chaperone required for assembly of F1-ATPase